VALKKTKDKSGLTRYIKDPENPDSDKMTWDLSLVGSWVT